MASVILPEATETARVASIAKGVKNITVLEIMAPSVGRSKRRQLRPNPSDEHLTLHRVSSAIEHEFGRNLFAVKRACSRPIGVRAAVKGFSARGRMARR